MAAQQSRAEAPSLLPPEELPKAPPAKRARRAPSADGAKKAPVKAEAADDQQGAEQGAEEPAGGRASLYVVTKAVRNFLKGLPVPIHCGADFIPALNTMLQQQLNDAVSRAKANGRKTVRSSDL